MAAQFGCTSLLRSFRVHFTDSNSRRTLWPSFVALRQYVCSAKRKTSSPPLGRASVARTYSSEAKDDLVVKYLDGQDYGIVVVGINRPKAKNAISKNLVKMMSEAVENIKKNNKVRSVILCSLVPGIFCAGADLKERAKMYQSEVGPFVSKARALITELVVYPFRRLN